MILSRFIDGLIPFFGGIYATLIGAGVIRASKNPQKAAASLKRFGTPLKILGPMIALWGAYLLATSF